MAEAAAAPKPSAEQIHACLKDLETLPSVSTDWFYLISSKWVKNLREEAANNSFSYEPLDNTVLLDEVAPEEKYFLLEPQDRFAPRLKRNLSRATDFLLVTQDAWSRVVALFGGGPEIRRRSILLPESTASFVEIHPCVLTVHGKSSSVIVYASRTDKIGAIVDAAAAAVGLSSASNLRCINYLAKEMGETLSSSSTIAECGLETTQDLLLDDSSETSEKDSSSKLVRLPVSRGLINVSNSCYVNSSVQALAHVLPLRQYLAPDDDSSPPFVSEINMDNKMGHKGAIVTALSETLQSLYAQEEGKAGSALLPRSLLKVIGKLSTRFASIEQQDAQELLSAILDGLHEDVNRVKGPKPYHPDPIETDSTDDGVLAEKSQEAWKRHLERDDSFVVDSFHGQLQSELCCSSCGKKNIRWEPFSSLVLPLPLDNNRTLKPLLIGFPGFSEPTYVEVTIDRRSTIADFINATAQLVGLTPEMREKGDLVVADIYVNKIHKIFNPTDKVASISSNDQTGVYFVAHHGAAKSRIAFVDYAFIPVIQRAVKPTWNPTRLTHELQGRTCGLPLIVQLPKGAFQVPSRLMLEVVADYLGDVCTPSNLPNSSFSNNFTLSVVDRQGRTLQPIVDTLRVDLGFGMPDFIAPSPAVVSIPKGEKLPLECLSVDWDIGITDHSVLQKPLSTRKASMNEASPPNPSDSSSLSLQKCLTMFTKVEQLDANNAWNCSGCKQQRIASKVYSISRLPRIMIVALKRFSADPWGSESGSVISALARSKLNNLVQYPLQDWDLTNFLTPLSRTDNDTVSKRYDLVSIINHYGNAVGGHYTAYCKESNGLWYCFDDNHVTKVAASELISSAAYVLVYVSKT